MRVLQNIRVRFAPSPTGALHIGGARTALFNWLFARSQGGTFILRLEDTDLNRSTLAAASGIIDGLKWLGLDWDEGPDKGGPCGPYRQSDRLPIYQDHINQLLNNGRAYYCFCTADDLSAERAKAAEQKLNYRHHCPYRDLSASQAQQLIDSGKSAVVRLKMPEVGSTTVHDLVRGQVSFDNQLLDDIIIQKSDGWPTYNFAVVIDDHFMKITHVLRGEEHITNTPKQIMVYQAFDWDVPTFGHMTIIVNEEKKKLSKRDVTVMQFLSQYADLGYLPQAMLNFITLLGWSPGGEEEILSKEEIIELFDESRLSKAPAMFDKNKLTYINSRHIKNLDSESFMELCRPFLEKANIEIKNDEWLKDLTDLFHDRVSYGAEIVSLYEEFFNKPFELGKEELNFLKEANSKVLIETFITEIDKINLL